MEDAAIGETPYPFEGEGDSVVMGLRFEIPPRNGEGDRRAAGVEGHAEDVPPSPQAMENLPVPLHHAAHGPPPRAGEELGRVWINPTQYFSGVSETAWAFHIGGYQPAQKWLKDRKGRALSWDDVRHYQKIIKILNETDRIMRAIDLPLD